jgi:hypothetical protein
LVGILVAVVAVVVLGVAALAVAGSGEERSRAAVGDVASATSVTTVPTTTTTPPPTPAEAFTSAARRLEQAGTFAYRGTANASDVSAVRPSLWIAFETTVDGQAQLGTGRLHEVAVAANGEATETVTDGTVVWGRSADHRDALGERGFQRIPALSTPEPATKGVTNLPRWLAAAVAPSEAGVDPQGRRSYAATIPAAVLGPTERERRAVDAQVLLVVDRRGEPIHVQVTTVPSGPPLHLALDLSGLGTPVTIAPPA